MDPEPAARPRLLRLTQARIGDTLPDGNGPHVTVVNAFTTVNPATEAIRASRRLRGGRCAWAVTAVLGRCRRRRALEASRGRGIVTAAAVEARYDSCEADDHVTCDRFRTGLADALMKFCRHLFATTNLIYLSRQIPLLLERFIVLLSGGYDRVDIEALAAAAARPAVTG